MKAVGLDIGTTSICAVLIDADSGVLLESYSLPNQAAITGGKAFEKAQDPEFILSTCQTLLTSFLENHSDIVSIGLTGQMHGILYLDDKGRAISPLYTWQDNRGNEIYKDNLTYAEYLTRQTAYPMATGYGLTTHFYQTVNHLVPQNAAAFCNIADYVVMSLTGKTKPASHPSMAASFGFYNTPGKCFELDMLQKVGLDPAMLPAVAVKEDRIGVYKDSISVSAALGDNQASFLGSINQDSLVLVNVGTSGQISIFSQEYTRIKGFECRPYIQDGYILVGAALCGGYAYNILKNFFAQSAQMMGLEAPANLYEFMNQAALQAALSEHPIRVDTRFNGTRENPEIRGSITHIAADTFTPQRLCRGVLQGICDELYAYLLLVPDKTAGMSSITASGNGLRKNPVLQSIFAQTFGVPVRIPKYTEEASYGAALFSLLSCNYYSSLEQLQTLIAYQA
jgi:sedoheptulokinase